MFWIFNFLEHFLCYHITPGNVQGQIYLMPDCMTLQTTLLSALNVSRQFLVRLECQTGQWTCIFKTRIQTRKINTPELVNVCMSIIIKKSLKYSQTNFLAIFTALIYTYV